MKTEHYINDLCNPVIILMINAHLETLLNFQSIKMQKSIANIAYPKNLASLHPPKTLPKALLIHA
jgi:hypothetical protein